MTLFTLRIQSPSGGTTDRAITGDPVTFGRSAEADIVCVDGSMSRRHARIGADQGGWFVEDLGARNGTFLNGTRIQGRMRLVVGDVITMGATVARVVAPPPAPPAGVLGGGLLGSSIFRSVDDLAPDLSDAVGGAPAKAAVRLKALNDFHRALAGAIELDALLALLLGQLVAALGPEEGVILLRQPDGTMRTAASRRLPGATGDLLVSQRLVHEVVEKRTAALVTDVAVDERFAGAQSVVSSGVRSILAAPFTDTLGCLGMVAIYSRGSVRRFGEEDLELLVSLASAAALRIRNVELSEAAAARRVQDRELALAHDIQMSMLPRAMPARPEIEMAATLIPARAVGGDLYDFLLVGDALWFVVADAAGKGVSAALFMAVTRTLFRAAAHGGGSVATVVARMNAELARDNDRQFFVTAVVGRLDLRTGALTWCNAGHPPPLSAASAGAVQPLEGSGIALGILEDAAYAEASRQLQPGETVLLFTDGVTEAVNAGGALFTDERLLAAITRSAPAGPGALVHAIVGAVHTFAGTAPQEDDITVLAMRFVGASH